jgi:hypothetical protein
LKEPKRKNNRQSEKKPTSSVASKDNKDTVTSHDEKSSDNGITIKTSHPHQVDNNALENYTKNLENIDNSLNTNHIQDVRQTNWISPKNLDVTASAGLTPGTLATATSLFNHDSNYEHQQTSQTLHRDGSVVSSSISPGSTSGIPSAGNASNDFRFLMSPSIPNDFEALNYNDLKSTLRDYMFANATNFESSTDIFNSNLNDDIMSIGSDDHVSFLTKSEEKVLMKNYLYKVAPWLDMFDLSRQMGLKTVQLAKKSPCLRYAILALSAKQIEKTDLTYDPSKSNILYQYSLKNLIPTVKKSPNIGAISACVILCVLDMMSISPEKWRYHLEGCSALFKATGINGFSEQYERALFWVFARMDVNSAVIGDQSTMIESSKWIPEDVSVYDAGELFKKSDSYEMFANYMVFLCSRVLNLISTENDNFEKEWELLWTEINQWHKDRPDIMKPIIEFESSPFPEVLYDNGPAISSNQLYHMAMILLIENKPRLFKINPKLSKPPTWHAKQICSISLHNDHHGCWNNSVQTLWIAGKLLTHEDEHRVILELLDRIESTTGWAMKFRAKDLIEFWGQS